MMSPAVEASSAVPELALRVARFDGRVERTVHSDPRRRPRASALGIRIWSLILDRRTLQYWIDGDRARAASRSLTESYVDFPLFDAWRSCWPWRFLD